MGGQNSGFYIQLFIGQCFYLIFLSLTVCWLVDRQRGWTLGSQAELAEARLHGPGLGLLQRDAELGQVVVRLGVPVPVTVPGHRARGPAVPLT